MLLTNRTGVKNTRDLLRAFGGLNETRCVSETGIFWLGTMFLLAWLLLKKRDVRA